MLRLIAILLLVLPIQAATFTSPSMSLTDVTATYNLASAGDTVKLPSGTNTWAGGLVVSKDIVVIGQADGSSRILYGRNDGFGLIALSTTSGTIPRLAYITFSNDGVHNAGTIFGMVQVNGRSHGVTLDHLVFTNAPGKLIYVTGDTAGVIDHCTVTNSIYTPVFFTAYCQDWNGTTDTYGDQSWFQPPTWGTTNAWYVESSRFDFTIGNIAISDAYAGARRVFRYNTGTNGHLDSHGTESTGRYRSIRQDETYNNTWVCTDGFVSFIFGRGGAWRGFNNSFTGYQGLFAIADYQSHIPFTFYGWNGTNQWCSNNLAIYTGTHTGTNGSFNLVDGSKSWTPNELYGLVVQNTSAGNSFNGVATHPFAQVVSNLSTAVFFDSIAGEYPGVTNVAWNTGDTYTMTRVVHAPDSIGSGSGILLSGNPPTPYAYINQSRDGAYFWNNTRNGLATTVSSNIVFPVVQEGRDFFNQQDTNYSPLPYPHPLVVYWNGGCSYSITPSAVTVAAAGISDTVAVTTSTNTCTWTAVSGASWLHVTGGSSGTGNGTVSYTVDANMGDARTGTILVAGWSFQVNQAASSTSEVPPIDIGGGVKLRGAVNLRSTL